MTVSPASARRLDAISGPDGIIVGAAVDHRDSLLAVLRDRGIDDWGPEQLSSFKQLVARVLAPSATLMLLDVETSAAQAVASGALPGTTGLALPLEAQGYEELDGGPATTLLDDWDPERTARLGADACKLLLPFRVDRPEHVRRQEELATSVAGDLHACGLALILEPIVFRDPDADFVGDEFAQLVIEGAARLRETGTDLLKVQYPGSADACAALSAACGQTPWVLLGGGADAAAIEAQVRDACRAGASGFVVGRTLFNDALKRDPAESERVLRERSLPLLVRLGEIARTEGTSWRDRVGPIAVPPLGWHRTAA